DGPLGGQKWWIWMSVLLGLLIAIIVGGLLYRRKLHKSIPSDQEKQNKNDDPQSAKQKSNFTSFPPLNDHSNINEQNKPKPQYGSINEVIFEKCVPKSSSASSSQEEKSAETSSTTLYSSTSSAYKSPLSSSSDEDTHTGKVITDKELEDEVNYISDCAKLEEASLYGSAHKSSRYRLVKSKPGEGNNNDDDAEDDDDDPDYPGEPMNVNITELSRASLKRKIEHYIAQADSSPVKFNEEQVMDDETLYIDGAGRYLLNKDIHHLSDLGNHSITTTKKRESLKLYPLLPSNESVNEDAE
ncbi:unnamed protein product, partial [Meganyctiphanes norvegica]